MSQHSWICVTCGVERDQAAQPPARCPICEDERQYLPATGQAWTTRADLLSSRRVVIDQEEPNLWSVRADPSFGIGQQAYLVHTPDGNLLWDCISAIDTDTVARIESLGGIQAIAISHPHYYSAMAAWSEAFGGAPVWLHEGDRAWVARRPRNLRFWSGERTHLFGGLSLVHSGGHFEGYQVAHWPAGAGGRGVLLAGDQPQVCLDRKWVTFMYSYPNWIPFGPSAIRQITSSLDPLDFDRLYGAFGRQLMTGAKDVIARSADRYLRAIAQ